jgi:hypothetical protein
VVVGWAATLAGALVAVAILDRRPTDT